MITYKAVHCLFVPSDQDQVYQYSSLRQYAFGRRLAIRLAGWAFYFFIRLIGTTVRCRVDGSEHLDAVRLAGRLPIYAVWHDRIFLGTYFLRDSHAVFLTSQSFDGEYIARFIQRFGYGAIRGSSTRGGSRGLVEMIRGMKRGLAMGFTVDGPRGPRYHARSGALLLAKKTGNPVVPFCVAAKHYWTINSWDRLQIPRPFTRAQLVFGRPIEVAADSDGYVLNEKLIELQSSLDELTERGEVWTE